MMYDERRETDSDPRTIEDIIAEHFPFDCNLIPIDAHTWAIHGSIPVAGDVILAEFSNREDAEAALKLLSAAEKTGRVPDSQHGLDLPPYGTAAHSDSLWPCTT